MDIKTSINLQGTEIDSVIYALAFRIGRGQPEKTELVMEQIERSDLYQRWAYAQQQADSARRKLDEQPIIDDAGFFAMLDRDGQHPEVAAELRRWNDEANTAWAEIEEYIAEAKARIEATGYDGAPS